MPEQDPSEEPHQPIEVAAVGFDRRSDSAPRLLARGRGEVAKRILEEAAANDIPIERDPDLLQCLGSLHIGEDIPVEAYQAVAQVLAFLYEQNAS